VEYCAEPIRPGLFRKLSVYRIGDTMVPATFVHETKWSAKRGEKGIADAELYEDEYAAARENRYGEALRCAFTLGHIEYGRADFGLVAGRPQVYEINTNPTIRVIHEHPFPVRLAASRYCAERLAEALMTIDTPQGGPPVNVDDAVLMEQRRRNRWMTYGRWIP
jgi:D-alanine-D-alanine ligase-like ATP-grasp enzyme